MTEQELISAYYEAANAVDGSFEFWLSATFAFLLAFHFTGHKFSKLLKAFLVGLYVLTSVLFIVRMQNAGGVAIQIAEALVANGSAYNLRANGSQSLLYFAVVMIGILGSVFYAITTSFGKLTEGNKLTDK